MAHRSSSSSSSSSRFSTSRSQRAYDPTALPRAWLDCPQVSRSIAYRFMVFKTPLDDRYREKISREKRWTCSKVIDTIKDGDRHLGLVIDLTNTTRFYDGQFEFQQKHISYEKIRCVGHDETPTPDQIKDFIKICLDFIAQQPESFIGVHCTHGFNRSGFMICSFLCEYLKHSIHEAIHIFAEARPPGIYKQDYLNKLQELYGERYSQPIRAPRHPQWDLEEHRSRSSSSNSYRRRDFPKKFAINHPNIFPVYDDEERSIQQKCKQLCRWERNDFLGSQPVALDLTNYQRILLNPYRVSWKADGTRYMMFIEGEDKIFMLDRNNSVFRINGLRFPNGVPVIDHLTNTLLDGEFVIDIDKGTQIPRYLVYDVVIYNNEYVGEKMFPQRLDLCKQITDARNHAIGRGLIDKLHEPFSIRGKPFYELRQVSHLLSEKFRQQITHGMDGLIFQPENEPYQTGASPHVFKWKDEQTVDFRLEIDRNSAEPKALLFVTRSDQPYATMPYSDHLEQYKGQIIECNYRENEWHFYRHRTDKVNPNAKATADSVMVALTNHLTSEMLCTFIDEQHSFDNY